MKAKAKAKVKVKVKAPATSNPSGSKLCLNNSVIFDTYLLNNIDLNTTRWK